ncbi:MAG: hypothetical protein MK209_03580 [Planctomycetes bacterium]|nr:hypothetical protein [Planctomycetota bacterium]
MKRALPALTRDLGRKLFALALALVVWWRVHQGIALPESREFQIVTEPGTATDALSILVSIPDGWQLIDPRPGEVRSIELKGIRRDVQDFLAGGVRAELVVTQSDVASAVDIGSVQVRREIEKIVWPDETRADRLLATAENEPFALSLRRIESDELALGLELIDLVEAEAFPDHLTPAYGELYFEPNVVTLTGPGDAIANAKDLNKELAQDLFEPLRVAPQENEVRLSLKLSERALEAGLTIEQENVQLVIPVYRTVVLPFVIVPPADLLMLGDPNDPSTSWQIQPNSYGGCQFEVKYRHHVDIDPPPTEAELRESIVFFVHLDDLPAGATTGQELPINWVIRDRNELADSARLQALKHAVTLAPLSEEPESRTVKLQKLD